MRVTLCKILSILFSFAVWLLNPFPADAQLPYMHHYTTADGLPSNTVYSAFQDYRGFIWFSTDLGIARFDGHHFKKFTTDDGLPDNEVFKIEEDPWHRLWICSYNGKTAYIYNDEVYAAANDSLCAGIEKTSFRYASIRKDPEYKFMLTGNGIYAIKEKSYTPVLSVNTANTFLSNYTSTVSCGARRYFFNSKGLFTLQKGHLDKILDLQIGTYVLCGNRLVAAGPDKIWDIHLGDKPLPKSIDRHSRLLSLNLDREGNIWVGTENGMIRYDSTLKKLENSAQVKLKGKVIYNMLVDKEGNNWYMTAGDGIYVEPAIAGPVYNKKSGLHSNNVLSVLALDDTTLVTGHSDGLLQLTKPGADKQIKLGSAAWNRILCISRTYRKNILLAGTDIGIFRVNIATGAVTKVDTNSAKACTYAENRIYFGFSGHKGLAVYSSDKTRPIPAVDSQNLAFTTVTAVAVYDNKIWLGSLSGIYYIPEGGSRQKWAMDRQLSQARITGIKACKNLLVAGTSSDGLFIWNGTKLLHLGKSEGLNSNICRGVYLDESERIWLCTDKGINQITIDSKLRYTISSLSGDYGLFTHLVNGISFKAGKAFVATNMGVFVLPQSTRTTSKPPGIAITAVNVKDSTFHYPANIVLSYSDNSMEIEYAGISFLQENNLYFRYLIEGDTFTTSARTIALNGLKPGTYRVQIWAVGSNKLLSKQPAVLSVTILTPFWQEAWFIIALGCFILLVLVFIWMKRIEIVKKKVAETSNRKRKIAELELKALHAQINPHFLFNVLNSIQNIYNKQDERLANYFMSSFAKLIRETLLNSRKQWITLGEEIAVLETYVELEQLRAHQSFQYEIDASSAPLTLKIPPMLLQVYVENAIHHGLKHLEGSTGRVHLSCLLKDDNLICRIEDNGIGFEAAARIKNRSPKHQSIGLKLNSERIETINELYSTHIQIEITQQQQQQQQQQPGAWNTPVGTIVTITIPQKAFL